MKLKQMSKEELELLSYTDLTYMILKENKKSMTAPTIFKKICARPNYLWLKFLWAKIVPKNRHKIR